ncbi:MAG: L,D-transpeptidase family protein [Lentisphaerae bacterium]|nr:L,D-transpeptidase family protein [Lentisphaerota bacterium]
MADDLDNLMIQGPERRSRLAVFLLVILLVTAGIATVVLIRSCRASTRRSAQALSRPVSAQPTVKPQQRAWQTIRALYANKSLAEARAKGYELLAQSLDQELRQSLETLLGQINFELLLSPAAMPEKEEYLVQSGDNLERIARKFKTTAELIKKSNALDRPMLHPGDRLLVFKGACQLAISKSRNDLVLSVNNRFFKRYRVGTGKYGSTPVGTFVITDKIEQPDWWRPDGKMVPYGDKENILGTRWMSLTATGETPAVRGYGLHGTWQPETIGQQASAGCVRLANNNAEELFLLLPLGTPVAIAE